MSLLPICVASLLATTLENATTHRRELLSPGCSACCFRNDCHLAFSSTSPGVCCGTHPRAGCCPLGSSCVQCGGSWRCTNSRYVTRRTAASVCRAGYGGGGYAHGPGYAPGPGYAHGPGYGPGYGHGYYLQAIHGSNLDETGIATSVAVLLLVVVGVVAHQQRRSSPASKLLL